MSETIPWIEWAGGDFMPIPAEMFVTVLLRDGSIEGPAKAREFAGSESCWKHRGSDGDIVAYSTSHASLVEEIDRLTKERDSARATDAENLAYIETMRTRLAEAKASRDLQANIAAEEETRSRHAEASIEKLQAALAFWMPGVSEGIEIELNGRAGDDAYLLAGFDGEVPTESWGDKTLARAEKAEAENRRLREALEAIPLRLRKLALEKFEEGKQAASINIRNAAQIAEDLADAALQPVAGKEG